MAAAAAAGAAPSKPSGAMLLTMPLILLMMPEIIAAGVKTTLPKAKQQMQRQHNNHGSPYDDMMDRSGSTSRESPQGKFATHYHGGNWEAMLTEEQRLLYHLLRNYEKAVRPVRNASHPIVVKLGMTLTNIFDMDEKNQVLTINVWLDQEWKDELLRWDPKEFSNIQALRIPCDLIWLPDIVLYNNADDYTAGYMRSRAMVFYDGTVFWPPPTQLRSTCKISVTYFPFDSQRCSLKFGSWTYHGFQVDITNRSDNVDLTNYVVSGEFDLVHVHQKRRVVKYTCCPEPYPDVTFYIHIRRKTLYYMYNVIFPCLMMSVLTLLVFLLPPDSGEKISLGITVLLAFSVFVLAIAEKMPETSDAMPLIAVYLTIVMGMSSVSVVMTVMVLNFHHRGPFNQPIPPWIRRLVLQRLKRILGMKLTHPLSSQNGSCTRNGSLNSNGVLRRMSSRLQLDDFVISNAVTDPRKDFFMETEQIAIDHPGDSVLRKKARKLNELHTRLIKTLEFLIKRQEVEDHSLKLANEWRQVAQVIDRLLFWIFLVLTIVITAILLLVVPIWHYTRDDSEFDESQYGLH
uniref:Nicotinic acetylcholine receptor subunit n=1 Tax=Panagrellus redivivus TaxID=6233 RepID=A0A7E4ZU22_PANRE